VSRLTEVDLVSSFDQGRPGRRPTRCLIESGPSLRSRRCSFNLARHGQDPSDPDQLDRDDDGIACEDHPDYPEGSARDETPVGQDTGGGDDTGGGEDTGGGNGELPFTGPNDTMLPAGAALLVAGGLLLGVTRYRARHARR
jgi:hypothetical protein